jgi:hypothetical protein
LQTFLLPFDPEDHEDSDEWKAYEGELSTKELHKVWQLRLPSAEAASAALGCVVCRVTNVCRLRNAQCLSAYR